ncbi:18260_t:CDS:1, partial [Rhizophagus irregularis]
ENDDIEKQTNVLPVVSSFFREDLIKDITKPELLVVIRAN